MKIHKVNTIPEDAEIGMRWIHYIWGDTSGWVEIVDREMKNPNFLINVMIEIFRAHNYSRGTSDYFDDPIEINIDENRKLAVAKYIITGDDNDGNDMEFMWWK